MEAVAVAEGGAGTGAGAGAGAGAGSHLYQPVLELPQEERQRRRAGLDLERVGSVPPRELCRALLAQTLLGVHAEMRQALRRTARVR